MKSIVQRVFFGILIGFGLMNVTLAEQQVPPDKVVYEIHVYGSSAVLRFSPAEVTTEGCGGGSLGDTAVVIDWGSNVDHKLLYAAVLTAQVTGKLVGFGVAGCHPWGGGVPAVYRVDVEG